MPSQWRIGFALNPIHAASTNKKLYTTYIRLSLILAELAALKIAVEANWHDVCDALDGDLSQRSCMLLGAEPTELMHWSLPAGIGSGVINLRVKIIKIGNAVVAPDESGIAFCSVLRPTAL